MSAIANWFGPELWIALYAIFTAAGIDAVLTIALAVTGKVAKGVPFEWKRIPQFLLTNVLPYAVGLILGAVLTKYQPELKTEYLVAAAGVSAWLARDWRAKFTILMGFKAPDTLDKQG